MVWPTLGLRTAKGQNRVYIIVERPSVRPSVQSIDISNGGRLISC